MRIFSRGSTPRPRAKGYCIALTLVFCVACLGTETGNPPLQPEVRQDLLSVEGSSAAGVIRAQGAPGAVTPGVEVQLYILQTDVRPVRVPVEDDGSFVVETTAFGAVARLQAISQDLRSDVIDVVLLSESFAGCPPTVMDRWVRLETTPDVATRTTVEVTDCVPSTDGVTLTFGDSGFSIGDTRVEGTSLLVDIDFDGRAGEHEDFLTISNSGKSHVVSLVAEACDDCR